MKKSFAALAIVLIFLMYPVVVAGSNLDYVWGSFPSNLVIIGVEDLDEAASLRSGEWFQVVYEIKVSKNALESEDVVRQRVIEHFEQVLGKTIREHPELRIYYAEYRCYMTVDNVVYQEYYYRAKIVGKVEPLQLKHGTPMVSWVTVAVIVSLILACIVATIVLVQQPAVQKLIVSTSEAIHTIAQNPLLTGAWTIVAIIVATSFLIIILALTLPKRKR